MSNKEKFIELVGRTITNIKIPNNITKIGANAFSYCSTLSNIEIPNNITELSNNCFESSGLTSIVVPSNIIVFGEGVFLNCTSLTAATVSNGVAEIGTKAFSGCTLLERLEIASTVSKIGNSAFASVGKSATTPATIVFNQPSGMAIELGTGLFSMGKVAVAVTIYTDNETIKNYDYSADNATPTFYHLDGSAWE